MKKIIALLLAAALVMSLAACSSSDNSESSSKSDSEAESSADSETVETSETGFTPALDTSIESTLYFVGSYGNFEALDQVALDFKEYYPNVEVVYTKLDDYNNDLANRFSTGNEVDLFMSTWWDTDYTYAKNIINNAEDLTSAGIDFSGINSELLSSGNVDGAQLVVPIYMQSWGYMVNLDIFKSAGIDVPTDYQSLLSACEKLTEAGYEKPIYMNSGLYGRSFIGYYMEQKIAGSDDAAALENTLTRMDELVSLGYVNDEGDTLDDSYEAQILRFFEGDVPMEPISLNNFSGTAKREAKSEAFTENPFEYAYIPAPYGDTAGTAYIDQLSTV